jgi:hypothetical protein
MPLDAYKQNINILMKMQQNLDLVDIAMMDAG